MIEYFKKNRTVLTCVDMFSLFSVLLIYHNRLLKMCGYHFNSFPAIWIFKG